MTEGRTVSQRPKRSKANDFDGLVEHYGAPFNEEYHLSR